MFSKKPEQFQQLVAAIYVTKNAAKRSRQHAGKNTGNMPSAMCASSMNNSLDPTPI